MNALNYYTLDRCKQIVRAVDRPGWRIWKAIDYDENTIQSKFPIASGRDLLKFVRYIGDIKALYHSVSTFLNAQNNHGAFYKQNLRLPNGMNRFPRKGYIIADDILLDTFYFIDIDHPTDLSIVQEDGRKIIQAWGRPQFLRYSGTKGIHIGYPQKMPEITNPLKNIKK